MFENPSNCLTLVVWIKKCNRYDDVFLCTWSGLFFTHVRRNNLISPICGHHYAIMNNEYRIVFHREILYIVKGRIPRLIQRGSEEERDILDYMV